MGSAQEDKNNMKGWRLGAYQPNRTQDIKSNQLKAFIKISPGNSFSFKKKKNLSLLRKNYRIILKQFHLIYSVRGGVCVS